MGSMIDKSDIEDYCKKFTRSRDRWIDLTIDIVPHLANVIRDYKGKENEIKENIYNVVGILPYGVTINDRIIYIHFGDNTRVFGVDGDVSPGLSIFGEINDVDDINFRFQTCIFDLKHIVKPYYTNLLKDMVKDIIKITVCNTFPDQIEYNNKEALFEKFVKKYNSQPYSCPFPNCSVMPDQSSEERVVELTRPKKTIQASITTPTKLNNCELKI